MTATLIVRHLRTGGDQPKAATRDRKGRKRHNASQVEHGVECRRTDNDDKHPKAEQHCW
jgi:hypothetical protein